MKIIAHRGASGLALENTLSAIKEALKLDIDAIEFDVRHTKDKHLILLHDGHTGRIAKKKMWAHKHTLKELQKNILSDGKKLTTLAEALKTIGGKKHIVMDIKDSNIYQEILELLSHYPTNTVSFTGRQVQQMQYLHQQLPETTFYVQGHFNPFDVVHTARRVRAAGISLNAWLMNPLTYFLAKRANLHIRVYTVNYAAMMWFIRVLYPGVEVFTNHPHRYIQKKPTPIDALAKER